MQEACSFSDAFSAMNNKILKSVSCMTLAFKRGSEEKNKYSFPFFSVITNSKKKVFEFRLYSRAKFKFWQTTGLKICKRGHVCMPTIIQNYSFQSTVRKKMA